MKRDEIFFNVKVIALISLLAPIVIYIFTSKVFKIHVLQIPSTLVKLAWASASVPINEHLDAVIFST